MFNKMKPGHILRFGTCPSTIHSPPGIQDVLNNDNTRETFWPNASNLGMVQCFSRPTGPIGPIASIATRLRTMSVIYPRAEQFLIRNLDTLVGS